MCSRKVVMVTAIAWSIACGIVRAEGGTTSTTSPAPAEVPIGSAPGEASPPADTMPAETPASKPSSTGAPSTNGPGPDSGTSGEAHPQDDTPELMLFKDIPIVVAAGKREQTQSQAPASVSVINANDIELFGYRSLADVLRNQRSFYLHTDGLNWFAGVRGFLRPGEWNSRITVTVDGRPTNEMIFGQSHLDQDFVVPMEAVKRVEIIRGPGSALYGSSAVFGVINVVTKDGADVNGAQLRLTGGTQETGRAAVLYGMAFPDGWDVLASITGYTSQGDKNIKYDGVNDADHNFGHIKNFDGEGVESAFVKARKGDFTIQLDFEDRLRDNRSATYLASFFDPGHMHEQRANIATKYDHEFQPGQSIHAMAFWGHYAYGQDYAVADSAPLDFYTTKANDDWLGEEVHYDWKTTKALHLLVGADGRQTLFAHQNDLDTVNGQILNVPSSTNTWGVFGEAELKATPWLTLTGGLRLDGVQRTGMTLSPRFAAIVNPTKQDTIKALYGRAFRAPNLYEQLYNAPGNVPNPNLKPEIADTYELVWERQFTAGWRTSLGGYLWKMEDAMENFVYPDGDVQTRNGSTVWAHGVEAQVDRKWDNGASLRAYATYTQTNRAGDSLTHSPTYIVGAAGVIPVCKRTFLSIEPQLVGPMKSDLGEYTASSFITNIVLTSRDVFKGWDVQAGLYNLFSSQARLPRDGAFNQYQSTLNYPEPQFLVSVTHRF